MTYTRRETITATTNLTKYIGRRVEIRRYVHGWGHQILQGRFDTLSHQGSNWAGGLFKGEAPGQNTSLALDYDTTDIAFYG